MSHIHRPRPRRSSDGSCSLLAPLRLLADYCRSYFSGHSNKDIAFLHKPSKTVIAADLLFNNPPNEQVGSTLIQYVALHLMRILP